MGLGYGSEGRAGWVGHLSHVFSVTDQAEGAPFLSWARDRLFCGERGVQVLRSEPRVGFGDGGFFTPAATMIDDRPCPKDCNVFTILVTGASFHAVATHTI
jgi:hypothetical protein